MYFSTNTVILNVLTISLVWNLQGSHGREFRLDIEADMFDNEYKDMWDLEVPLTTYKENLAEIISACNLDNVPENPNKGFWSSLACSNLIVFVIDLKAVQHLQLGIPESLVMSAYFDGGDTTLQMAIGTDYHFIDVASNWVETSVSFENYDLQTDSRIRIFSRTGIFDYITIVFPDEITTESLTSTTDWPTTSTIFSIPASSTDKEPSTTISSTTVEQISTTEFSPTNPDLSSTVPPLSSNNGLSDLEIALIAVGSLTFVAILVIICCVSIQHNNKKNELRKDGLESPIYGVSEVSQSAGYARNPYAINSNNNYGVANSTRPAPSLYYASNPQIHAPSTIPEYGVASSPASLQYLRNPYTINQGPIVLPRIGRSEYSTMLS